jgi:hypothetical protein
MVIGGLSVSDGPAKVVVLGLGHSVAQALAAVIMWVVLRRRLSQPLFPHAIWRALGLSALLGAGAWLVVDLLSPHGRVPTLAVLAVIGLVGGGAYLAMLRLLPTRVAAGPDGVPGMLVLPPDVLEPDDPDLVADLDL